MRIAKYKKIPLNELKKIVKKSNSMSELLLYCGYRVKAGNYFYLKKYLKDNNIKTDHFFSNNLNKNSLQTKDLFIANSSASRKSIKNFIIKNKLLPYKCSNSKCLITNSWLDEKLVLILDHINGINNDHRLSNLRFLCPNCNSQTITFASKNKYTDTDLNNDIQMQKYQEQSQNTIKHAISKSESLRMASKLLKISPETLKNRCLKYNIDYVPIFEKNKQDRVLAKKKQDNKNVKINKKGSNQKKIEENKFLLMKEKQILINLLKEKRNLSAVGIVLNISATAVRKKCKKHNINYLQYYKLDHMARYIVMIYLKTKSLVKTATYFQTSVPNIKRILKNEGQEFLVKYRKIPLKDIELMKQLLISGKTIIEISKKLKISDTTVKFYKKRFGLTKK